MFTIQCAQAIQFDNAFNGANGDDQVCKFFFRLFIISLTLDVANKLWETFEFQRFQKVGEELVEPDLC